MRVRACERETEKSLNSSHHVHLALSRQVSPLPTSDEQNHLPLRVRRSPRTRTLRESPRRAPGVLLWRSVHGYRLRRVYGCREIRVQQPIAVRKKHVQVHAFTRVDVDTERVLVRRVWEGFVQSVRRVLRETGA